MFEQPKVSVVISSYNHERYLPECLDSILAQTFRDFEIVIYDDGSKDDSHTLLSEYQHRNPKQIFFYWHPGHANKGLSITSNLAILKARGKYIAFIGSDDIWYPDKLELQVAQLENDPTIGVTYSPVHFIDQAGNLLPWQDTQDVSRDPNPVGRLIQSCHPPAMTVIVRRACLDEVGLFDEELVYSDWDLMVRCFARWKGAFIDQPLAKYRLHNQNMSKGINPHLDRDRILAVMQALRQKAPVVGGELNSPRNLAHIELQTSFLLFCSGKTDEAFVSLHKAFEIDPSLSADRNFLSSWLNAWKPGFYTSQLPHFGLWVAANLPPSCGPEMRRLLVQSQFEQAETKSFFVGRGVALGLERSEPGDLQQIFDDLPGSVRPPDAWLKQVLAEVYATLLFETNRLGQRAKVKYFWIKAIQHNPAWLHNRGIWAIGWRALFTASES